MNTPGRTNPFIHRQPLKTGGRGPFMERVRKSLGHPADRSPPPSEAPPERDESVIRQCAMGDPALVDRWIERARANSMVIHRAAADPPAVSVALSACLAHHKIARCILNARDLEIRYSLAQLLASRSIDVMPWGSPGCRKASFACDASITDCRAGLADAGSLLVWSDSGFGRSSTLVVPVHIVVLPASRIIPDMIDGLGLVARTFGGSESTPPRLPSNIVIINGPSKTADIEMNLVTGVHGPKYLYVVVIDNL
jgi:L-lactate dehydrogenase complex protein LldG